MSHGKSQLRNHVGKICHLGLWCFLEDQILRHPPPTREFLSKLFCLQPGLERKFLLRRTCCRGKNCSDCNFSDFYSLSKGNQVSLVRIHFSHPESDGKSADADQGESNMWLPFRVAFAPPFPKRNLPFSGAGKRPVSMGSPTVSTERLYESTVFTPPDNWGQKAIGCTRRGSYSAKGRVPAF